MYTMNKTYMERFKWVLKEGLMVALILIVWNAVAILLSQGIGNIGISGPGNLFTILGSQLANAAAQAGLISAVLYLLVRAGTYLIDYHAA